MQKETWPETLPGCEQVLRFVRDPLDYARQEIARLRAEGKLANLARNGDFASDTAASPEGPPQKHREGGPPAGWSAWQDEKSHGQLLWDRGADRGEGQGSARAAGVAQGCFLQSYAVEPGQRYAVAAWRKVQGRGEAAIRVRWQTADSRWTREGQDRTIFADGAAEAKPGAWSPMFGVVEVPEGVGRLVLLLGAAGQAGADDAAWYDDVAVYRLP